MKLEALYKRSTTGKTSFLQIEVEGNKFRTESGFLHGKKVISDWTECKSKSYCTAEEQALKQAQAIHKKKIESGMFTNIEDIDGIRLFEPMLAEKWDKYKDKVKYPIFSQPKLDGMRCIIKKDGMWSRTGKKILSSPHIFKALQPLFEQNPNLIFDGELYCDKLANDFNKLISLVSKKKPTKDELYECEKYIEYHIYDLPSSKFPFSLRSGELMLIKLPNCCKLVSTYLLNNEQEVKDKFNEYISEGYEGQMLRLDLRYENKRSKSLMKDKEMETEEFIILSINEGVGKMANKAGTITCRTQDGILFESAINGTHEYLEDLWKRRDKLIGKEATIRYFAKTNDGSLRFPKVIDIARWDFE